MAQVSVKQVYKTFENGFQAAKDINFTAEDQEFVVLVGPSGCGKTTILRMIAGLETITSGSIYIDDVIVNDIPPKDRDIAMVFQNYALYPHMSVYENLAFALKLRKYPKADIDQKVQETAKMLGLDQLLQNKPKQLSGGQRQRVALGRAIVRNPKVFLFDEPLSNLDAKMRVQMRTEIAKIHQTLKSTVIYVTHDQVEAMTMGSKIIVMEKGVILQIDSPLAIYNSPKNIFVATFMGNPAMNIIRGELTSENGTLYFQINNFTFPIPKPIAQLLANYPHQEIIFGIRPEDIYDSRHSNSAELPASTSVFCDLVEPLGNEYVVHLKLGDNSLVARFDPKYLPEIQKPLDITFDISKGHFFDAQTELRIMNYEL